MIDVKVVADSLSPEGIRLTSFSLTYHRWILAEVNTHRMFSRSSASSRAIPFATFVKRIQADPAYPVRWIKNAKGMFNDEEIGEREQEQAKVLWKGALEAVLPWAHLLAELGVHKQIVNRLLEPFMFTKTIITATDWANCFNLRTDAAAQPEFRVLATKMASAYESSQPVLVDWDAWHLPYVSESEQAMFDVETLKKCAVSRCARVSYMNHDGTQPDIVKDMQLHDTLLSSRHMSPFEHVATPATRRYFANFFGWKQYRKYITHENVAPGKWQQAW